MMRKLLGVLIIMFFGQASSAEILCKYEIDGEPSPFMYYTKPDPRKSSVREALEPACVDRPDGFEGWALRLTSDNLGPGYHLENLSVGMYIIAGNDRTHPSDIVVQIERLRHNGSMDIVCLNADLTPCYASLRFSDPAFEKPVLSLEYSKGNPRGEQLEFFLNIDESREAGRKKYGSEYRDLFWHGLFPELDFSLHKGIAYTRLISDYILTRVAMHGSCGLDLVDAPINRSQYTAIENGFGHLVGFDFAGIATVDYVKVPTGFDRVFRKIADDDPSEERVEFMVELVQNLDCQSAERKQLEANMISFIMNDFDRWLSQ